MPKVQKAIIPAAGLGTRLLPATKSQPKEMLPVGRKPCVQHIVEELLQEGINQVLFVTGQGKSAIENHFDRNLELESYLSRTGREDLLSELALGAPARFFFTRQSVPRGLGDAVLHGKEFAGDGPFVVALGDSIIAGTHTPGLLKRMATALVEMNADAVVAVQLVEPDQVRKYGIVAPEGDLLRDIPFRIADLIEKPSAAEAPSRFAIAGRYIFNGKIFDALERTVPQKGGEVQLTDAMRILIRQGGTVVAVPLEGDEVRYDIGNFLDYYKALLNFLIEDEEYGPDVRVEMRRLLDAKERFTGGSR